MKIQSRLDYFFVPKFLQTLIQECRIIPNTFSDHSALILTICFNEETAPCSPGYWRFNNSLLSDNEYITLLRSKIPKFVEKYKEVESKGLFWEMVKMEIRGLTVRFSKLKAKCNRDEEELQHTVKMTKPNLGESKSNSPTFKLRKHMVPL